MGKMDKLADEDEEDSEVGGNSSVTETNGTEKLSLLKQMLLAGIDKRQRQDGIRRTQDCVRQKVEGVRQEVDVNQKVEGVNSNVEGVSKNVEGEKQNAEDVKQQVEGLKQKVDGVKQKSEGEKEKIEGVPTVSQTSPGSQQKKRKKTKSSNEEPQKKEKKKRETKEEAEEEPVAKKTQKIAKEKEEEESEDSDSDDISEELQYSSLSLCLETWHRNLQRKDVYGVFSFPVTDSVAPGYSDIIKTPMDFLTMSRKISEQRYTSFSEFRDDFLIMCRNAILYYESGSVQHEAAEKLLTVGSKMFSNENVTKLNTSIGVTDSHDTNFTVEKTFNVNTFKQETLSRSNSSPPPLERRREDRQALLTASLLSAARKARETLMKKQSNQVYSGCLTENVEGKPALNILNADTLAEDVPERYTIGYAGRLPRGYRRKQERSDDKTSSKNNVIPVNYLLYGPYGSFGPSYDSSLSNLTKDESDMLIHTYASEGHKDYISDLMTYADDDYVDGILNALGSDDHKIPALMRQSQTESESNGTLHKIDQSKGTLQAGSQSESALQTKQPDENMEITDNKIERNSETTDKRAVKDVSSNLDLTSLLTLDRVGIDVSFLKDMMKPSRLRDMSSEKHAQSLEEVKSKLSQNAELLHALKQSQHGRFTTECGGTTDMPASEIKAATSITDNLKELMGMVKPKDVVSSQGVRKAIGVGKSSMHASVVPEHFGEVPMTH